jgi:hypothetical protein
MLEYNMRTFGKQSIGVHGKELPKFSQIEYNGNGNGNREWWKMKEGYKE